MRILRFDSLGGASGDMILSALTSLGGPSAQDLQTSLSSLGIGQIRLEPVPVSDRGLNGIKMTVHIPEEDHHHDHHKEPHHHRHLDDIRDMISRSTLPEEVKRMSISVFERLALVEAGIHGTTPDEVHFHEVGAADSVVDIVGSCLALHLLKIDLVRVSPLPLGSGTTKSEHGIIPVPVPATVELLKGHPVIQTDEPFELVTPTGAALLMAWKAGGPDKQAGTGAAQIVAVGHGFGNRKLNNRANLLRAILLETQDKTDAAPAECLVLECNLDDTLPELVGALVRRLMEKGALDVFTTPVFMKKQRPGILLTVLCRPEDRESFLDLIFRESTTFGIREYPVCRTVLERRHESVETPYGPVRIKIGRWKDEEITHSPEYEDCLRQADEHGVSVRAVYEAALQKARTPAS